jgi:serine-type D-Ala-D-Ala carboxypeptidase/endopeptidase (penicillin-binding protein 4)
MKQTSNNGSSKIRLFCILIFFHSIISADTIPDTVEALISQYKDYVHVGVEIISLSDGAVRYAQNEHHLFIPASSTKIVTALAAFHILGPEYRFCTQLLTAGEIKEDTLVGDLYIKGFGDPSLTTQDLVALFALLKARGITAITGSICIDTSTFDTTLLPSGYLLDNIKTVWYSPITAFMLDRKGPEVEIDIVADVRTPLKIMAQYNTEQIDQIMRISGISCQGATQIRAAKGGDMCTLAVHFSEPLHVLISHMMKSSDNIYADCICKCIGAFSYGPPGSWEKGIVSMKKFLETEIGIDPCSLVLTDGSGWSRFNGISAHQLNQLLRWPLKTPYKKQFVESLACCGVDGSLKKRLLEFSGRVKAKTGTLFGISALSGYIMDQKDEPFYVVSILLNGFIEAGLLPEISNPVGMISYKRSFEDAICAALIEKTA